MPCRGPDDLYKDTTSSDELVNMLCWIMTHIKETKWMRKDIQAWWKEHQRLDKRRAEINAECDAEINMARRRGLK